jgi:cytochrome c oxidase assembly factor CtaG
MAAASLSIAAALYVAGVARAWRRAGAGRSISFRAVVCFTAGWAALAIALSPAIDEWSDVSFAAHMVQHELLMVVAAPLLAWADTPLVFAWLLPRETIIWLRRLGGTIVPGGTIAAVAHALALWIWHVPALFNYARAHESIHALQHASFFVTAFWFWRSLSHGRWLRLGAGPAILYVFGTSLQSGALGALLAVSSRAWYSAGIDPAGALDDQRLAGLIMWIPASVVFMVAGLLYLALWLRESARRAAATDTTLGAFGNGPV